jgi:F5/8 type C domain
LRYVTSVRKAHPVALATLGYVLLTLAYSWPLPRHILHGVAHDPGDPILNAWILWWSTKAVPLTTAWWNAPMFSPAIGTFAYSEHLLGEAPIAWPIIALTGNPLFGYNVALLASYVLCGLGGYFLGFTLTRRHDAAFVAGVAYAFAPYRLAQLPHIQVLWSWYTPVCLAALHRYDRDAAWKWGALAATAWLMQSLANGYFMFFLTVLLACWFLWFALGRWPIAKLARVGACFAAAGLFLLPVVLGYKHILVDYYGFSRGLGPAQEYGADIGSLLHATDESWLWGWVHAVRKPEGELFPGPTIVALALFVVLAARPFATPAAVTRAQIWIRRVFLGLAAVLLVATVLPIVYGSWHLTIAGLRLVSIARADKPLTLLLFALLGWVSTQPMLMAAARRRSALPFYALAAFAMWVFALGPDPEFFGRRAIYQAPYGWLMRLPGFDGLRVPARFWMMALVCLSALAALAVNRLEGRARRVVATIAVIGLALDGWPREFAVRAQPDRRPTPPGVVARLDLPMTDDQDALALYQQTFDSVPLYNGFSGYGAPHQYAMRELLFNYDNRILQAMTVNGPLGVVIDHDSDPDGKYRAYVSRYPGAKLAETHPAWSSYVLPANGGGDLLPDEQGTPIAIAALTAYPSQPHTPRAIDGSLKTRWSGGVQKSAADFTVEIKDPGPVKQLVIDLGEFWTDFPMRLRIEVSPDGAQWETVYSGDTALQAYYAAVRHPRQVPVVYAIARDRVRFIRLTQLGWGTHDWSIPELRVLR